MMMTSDLLSPYVDRAREILDDAEDREELVQAIAEALVAQEIAVLRSDADRIAEHLDAVLGLASLEQRMRTEAETLAAAVREDED